MASSSYGGSGGTKGGKLTVRNKTAAPIQITAEQLLREAVDRQSEELDAPRQKIVDEEELQIYRVRKRKEFEDSLRRQRHHMGTWIKYAEWESFQKEFRRSRSIFERGLEVDYQNAKLWLKYIDMEMKNKFINSARNLYDRVTQLLPRVDQFWFKYAYMEEILGNYAGARSVFERWMEWEPEGNAWMMYIRFEERCGEIQLARKLFERYISCKPSVESFLRFIKFEEKHKNYIRARAGFEKAIETLPPESLDETFYIKFAEYEKRRKQMDRVKAIYQKALELLPKGKSDLLYSKYIDFCKQFASKDVIEDTVLTKRRLNYEEELQSNKLNYDLWFDYVRLEEECGDVDKIRDLYERAIANIPPLLEKQYWKRYMYLWYFYAIFEELTTKDYNRCRAIYDKAVSIVSHKQFSFTKLWQYYAEFEIRQLQLDRARRIFGRAIAECRKDRIFTAYAGIELRLGNIDRCRTILAKYVEMHPTNPKSWASIVELEVMTEEIERARSICEIAIELEQIDYQEVIWTMYINLEINVSNIEGARQLYDRLILKTDHFKVFAGYAEFEFKQAEDLERGRKILQRGNDMCKDNDLQEERVLLLEHWLNLEREYGDDQSIESVTQRQAKKIKRKRNILDAEGNVEGWEEYLMYIFPDDTQQASTLKILEAAKKWKQTKEQDVVV